MSSQVPSNGVPSNGIRKLTGIESESSSRSAKSASTSCSSLSPRPAIRPEHGESPAALALLDGVDAVGVRVGRDDVVVVGLGGVDVVVVGVDARRAQPLGLAVLEQAEARAHLDVGVLGLQRPDHAGDPLDVAVGRAAPAGHHADPGRAAREPGAGLLDRLVGLQPGVLEDVGLRAERLRAVVAVLGAQAGLEVDQVVDLDRVAEVLAAQPAGGGDEDSSSSSSARSTSRASASVAAPPSRIRVAIWSNCALMALLDTVS